MCKYHDSCLEPSVAARYLDTATTHGERFVLEASQQAQRFEVRDFDAILACSRLLTILGLAFYRNKRKEGVKLCDLGAWYWLHLLRGIKTVYEAIVESGVEIDPVMSMNMVPELPLQDELLYAMTISGMKRHHQSPYFPLISETRETRIQGLIAHLHMRRAAYNVEEWNDLLSAITNVERCTLYICEGEVRSLFRAICTWPGSITSGFKDMLLRNEHFALAIYAHWLMLMTLAADMWWVGDMGVAGIREIVTLCASSDPSLERVLEWPKKMLEIQIE